MDFETSRIDSKFRPEWFRVGKTHPEVTGYRNPGPEALQSSVNLQTDVVFASGEGRESGESGESGRTNSEIDSPLGNGLRPLLE